MVEGCECDAGAHEVGGCTEDGEGCSCEGMYHRARRCIEHAWDVRVKGGARFWMKGTSIRWGDSGGSFGVAVQSDETGWSCKAR
jgi:hypothetical protein